MRLALALVASLIGPALADNAVPATKKAPHTRRVKPAVTPASPRADYVATTYAPEPATNHKEGDYGGVEPGQTSTSPGKHKLPPKNTLNWVGFEAKDGGATVFFQAAAAFEVAQHVEGNQLVATIGLPRLGANAWRQVDTRFFDNPLSGVVAKAVSGHGKSGIEVRFSFKTAADAKEATLRTATEADGQYYAYLSFPPGTGATTTTTAKPDVDK